MFSSYNIGTIPFTDFPLSLRGGLDSPPGLMNNDVVIVELAVNVNCIDGSVGRVRATFGLL